MAMTLRLPPELDAALEQLAEARHTSKQSLVLSALDAFVGAQEKTARVLASVDRTLLRDAELLARLSDA